MADGPFALRPVTVITSPDPDLHQERRVLSIALLGSTRLVVRDVIKPNLARRPIGKQHFDYTDERINAFDLTQDGTSPCIWTVSGEQTGPGLDAMVGAEDDLFVSFNGSARWRIIRLHGETGSLIATQRPAVGTAQSNGLHGLHVQESRVFSLHKCPARLLSCAASLGKPFRESEVVDLCCHGGIASGGKGKVVVQSESQPGMLLVLSFEGIMLRTVHSPVMRLPCQAHSHANLQAAGRLMLVRATEKDLCVEDGPSRAANAYGNAGCEVVALNGETVLRCAYLAAEATCEAIRDENQERQKNRVLVASNGERLVAADLVLELRHSTAYPDVPMLQERVHKLRVWNLE